MRVVAIIQARSGSSRFPGKVLKELAGKPLLWHIIHRLRKCQSLDAIVVATSDQPADDAVAAFAAETGVEVVRGPENDVLRRYATAARSLEADVIVRVTGDSPFVDPATVDRMVAALIASGADYATGDPEAPSINEGVDPFTAAALEKLVTQASADPVAREHVTGYFKHRPGFASSVLVPSPPGHYVQGARMSVDTPSDLRFLEEVYRRLGVAPGDADLEQVVELLRSDDDLLQLNAHVARRAVGGENRKILFRCDGHAEIGLGHVVRCIAVADELRDGFGCEIAFAVARGDSAETLISDNAYPVERKPAGDSEAEWLGSLIGKRHSDALVLDVRSDLATADVRRWRDNGLVVATIDDGSERRLACDFAFYPPVPQLETVDWTGFEGRLFVGWEWVPLRRGFGRTVAAPHDAATIIVAMGASDPAGLTVKTVNALQLLDEPFGTVVLVGRSFLHDKALAASIAAGSRAVEVIRDVPDPERVLARGDIAICSLGVTAYELAALGVPAIHLALTEDHARSSSAFGTARIAISLGVHERVTERQLAEVAAGLLRDPQRRADMTRRARHLVDGKGAARIAAVLQGALVPSHV